MRGLGSRFWIFLAGQATSGIGSWATLVAIWGFAAFRFDADPADIGLVGLAWLLPPVLFGPIAGVPIDRYGPRIVLVSAKALGAVASVALIFADSYGQLVLFSIGHGVAYAFGQPALDSFPPRIVDDEDLASANALLRIASDLSLVLGPALAAVTIELWGFDGAFIADAATYVVGIAATLVVPMRPTRRRSTDRPRVWHEALEGFRLAVSRPMLRATILLTGSVYFLYGAALLIEPIYVRDVLDEPMRTFALLQTAFGVALVGFGVAVARQGNKVATREVLALAVAGSGLGALWYLGTTSVVMAFAGVTFWGAATAFVAGPSRTLLHRNAPEEAHGRVLALDRTMEGVGHITAMLVATVLATALGPRGAVLAIAVGIMAVGISDRVRARRAEVAGEPLPVGEPTDATTPAGVILPAEVEATAEPLTG